jgi:hypothetical protein
VQARPLDATGLDRCAVAGGQPREVAGAGDAGLQRHAQTLRRVEHQVHGILFAAPSGRYTVCETQVNMAVEESRQDRPATGIDQPLAGHGRGAGRGARVADHTGLVHAEDGVLDRYGTGAVDQAGVFDAQSTGGGDDHV